MIAPELKPCPFCGGDSTIMIDGTVEDDWCAVACQKCQAQGPHEYTDRHAIAAWNTRAPDPDLDAHIGAALNDAAQMVDCCCDQETKARVLSAPPNSAERWRGCGQANCGAMDADAILALRPTALTALDRAKHEARVEGMQAALGFDRHGIDQETADKVCAAICALIEAERGKP